MKISNIIQLGFVFAGCFLGAGFVSGQELWQFFGIYGKNGFLGLVLAIILFFVFGYIVLTLSQKTGIILMDEIVVPQKNGCSASLRNFVGFIQVFFITGIYIIMCAGAGALINQLLGLHIIVGSSIFCFLVCFVSLKGIRGVINVFSLFVPPLILGAVIIGIFAVNENGFSIVVHESKDTLFKNPVISALIYVSYNFFGSIGILAPVAQKYKSKKILITGTATGCVILALISLCILMAMNTVEESTFSQLPMLFIAGKINKFLGFAYAFFLLGAMFSTSLSSLVAVCEYVSVAVVIRTTPEMVLFRHFSTCRPRKARSLPSSFASKTARNSIPFRFKEFFANYFLLLQGKNAGNTGVLARLLTQQWRKRGSKKRGSDSYCHAKEKYNVQKKNSVVLTILLSFLACLLSLVGFDKLIGTIYPLCGAFGVFALVAIVVHYIKVKK